MLLIDRNERIDPARPVEVSEIIVWNRRRLLLVRQRPTPNSSGWKRPIDFGIEPGPQAVNPFTPAGELIVCDNYDNPPQEVAMWMREAIIAQLVRMGCTPVLVGIA